jgi:hypothetical protein
VSAIASGSTVQAATIARAVPGDSSPAAIGSHGLFTLSISTSVIWLTPTIATFTASAAISVASRSPAPVAWDSAAAIAYRPSTDRAVPMIVCGREKRHRTTNGRATRASPTAAAAARVTRLAAPLGAPAASARRRPG